MKQKIEDVVRDYMTTRKIANTTEGRQQIIDEIYKCIVFKYPVPNINIDVSLDNATGVFTTNVEIGVANETED